MATIPSPAKATTVGLTLALASAVLTGGTLLAAEELSPTPAEEQPDLLSRLVTEEVEPGVFRILSDGYRELSPPVEDYVFEGVGKGWGFLARTHQYRHIVAAPDGAVWVFEPDRFFRLGEEKQWGWRGQPELNSFDSLGIAPDGTLWRASDDWPQPVRSFDGRRWTTYRPNKPVHSVGIAPDGTVWTTQFRPFGVDATRRDGLVRWDGRRWRPVRLPRAGKSYGDQFEVTADAVWVCCKERAGAEEQRLLRLDGSGWEIIEDPSPGRADAPLLIDAADDGTLWLRRNPRTLARYDDQGWMVFESDDDDPLLGLTQEEGGFIRASPDGSVWVTVSAGKGEGNFDCDGLARFDGTTWSQYLPGTCIFAIDVTPDGIAWVQAARMDPDDLPGLPLEPIQTYAIRPTSAAVTPGATDEGGTVEESAEPTEADADSTMAPDPADTA